MERNNIKFSKLRQSESEKESSYSQTVSKVSLELPNQEYEITRTRLCPSKYFNFVWTLKQIIALINCFFGGNSIFIYFYVLINMKNNIIQL